MVDERSGDDRARRRAERRRAPVEEVRRRDALQCSMGAKSDVPEGVAEASDPGAAGDEGSGPAAREAPVGGAVPGESRGPSAAPRGPGHDEALVERIERLLGRMNDAAAVRGVRAAAARRLRELGRSSVVERYDHRDGYLQLEYRFNRATGRRQGPYWSYRFWRDGRQRKIYLGKTDSPEELLEEKLRRGDHDR